MNLFESTFEKHKNLMLEELSAKTLKDLQNMDAPQLMNVIKQSRQVVGDKNVPKDKQDRAKELSIAANNIRVSKLEKGESEEDSDAYGAQKMKGSSGFERIRQYMGKMVDLPYERFVPTLSQAIQNPKVQKFLLMAKEDSAGLADDKISIQEAGSVNVSSLRATQNEVVFKNSIGFPLADASKYQQIINYIKDGFDSKMPPIVISGNYVIDGHHRWSQAFSWNKNAKLKAIDISFPDEDPTEILKKVQLGIAATSGEVASTAGGGSNENLFVMSETDFLGHLKKALKPEAINTVFKNEGVVKIINPKNEKTSTDAEYIEKIIFPYLWGNVLAIRDKQGKYSRGIMPQTDAADSVKAFTSALEKGHVNFDVKTEGKIFESTFNKFKDLYTK